MRYRREALRHLIVRALKRNPYTADEAIHVMMHGTTVVLYGMVSDPILVPEAVATVEAVAPFLKVYSRLRVRAAKAYT